MLHEDGAIRRQKHDFMLRVFDAAALLGVGAVCGFVGRNPRLSMDENLVDFEQSFVPLLREAKARGVASGSSRRIQPRFDLRSRRTRRSAVDHLLG